MKFEQILKSTLELQSQQKMELRTELHEELIQQMQRQLEEIYTNFVQVLVGNTANIKGPVLVDWSINKAGNVVDEKGAVVYYLKANIVNEDFDLILTPSDFKLENGNLLIKTPKINSLVFLLCLF